VVIATDARALAELARVLHYDTLRLDAGAVAAHLDSAIRLSRNFDVASRPLPRCRDPDDQMFLEIGVAARAVALLTRDAELLRMARRMQREHGLAIIEPRAWRDVVDAARNAFARPVDQMSKR
jgi:predicted nucleic acid-binding protein